MTKEPRLQMLLETERRDIDANIFERYVGQEVIIDINSSGGAVAGTLKDYSRNFVYLGNGIKDMDDGLHSLLDYPELYSRKPVLKVIAPEMIISKSDIRGIISWREFMELYETAKKKEEENDRNKST